MKELDVLLECFTQRLLPQASAAECRVFAELLALPDPVLAGYLLGGAVPAEPHLAQASRRIRAYVDWSSSRRYSARELRTCSPC